MTRKNDSDIEPLAHFHVLDNPDHVVGVTATEEGHIHEECHTCDWWNDQ